MTNSSTSGRRFAICIGINTYPLDPRVPALLHAEEDAQAFYNLLDFLDVPQASRVLLLGPQATLEAINPVLDELLLREPGRRDLVIFYYAGYVIPLLENVMGGTAQARLDVLLATADLGIHMLYAHNQACHLPLLGMHTLRDEFIDDSPAQHQLFILDCYSASSSIADQHTVSEEVQWMAERMSQLMQYDLPGRFALTSCVPAQRALDLVSNERRFSSYVLKVLRGEVPEALRKDQTLTVQNLCAHVSAQFLPLNQRYTLSDDFIIAHYPLSRSVKTVPLSYNLDMTPQLRRGVAEEQASYEERRSGVISTNPLPTLPQTGKLSDVIQPSQEVLPMIEPLKTPSLDAESVAVPAQAMKPFVKRTKVFICYNEKDKNHYEALKEHLPQLDNAGQQIEYWDHTKIQPSSMWRKEIEQAIRSTRVAILLTSADSLNPGPDVIDELSPLLIAAEREEVTIIPVLARRFLLDGTNLEKFRFINSDKSLDEMKSAKREEIWTKVAREVVERLKVIETLEKVRGMNAELRDELLNSFPHTRYISPPLLEYTSGLSGSPALAVRFQALNESGLDGVFIVKMGKISWADKEKRLYDGRTLPALDPYLACFHMCSDDKKGYKAVAYEVAFQNITSTRTLRQLLKDGNTDEAQRYIDLLATVLVNWNSKNGSSASHYSSYDLLSMLLGKRIDDLEHTYETHLPWWPQKDSQIRVEGLKRWLPNPLVYIREKGWSKIRNEWPYPDGHVHGDLHTENVICQPNATTDGILKIIDFAMYQPDGNAFFDLAYLEFDVLQHVLPAEQEMYRAEWFKLLDFSMQELLPERKPQGKHAEQAWQYLKPIRQQVKRLIEAQSDPTLQNLYKDVWWITTVAVGLNFARKGVDDAVRPVRERVGALLYAAYGLERIFTDLDITHDETEVTPFVRWIRDVQPAQLQEPTAASIMQEKSVAKPSSTQARTQFTASVPNSKVTRRRQAIEEQLQILEDNLLYLQSQANYHGMDMPLPLRNNIKFHERKIEELETELVNLPAE